MAFMRGQKAKQQGLREDIELARGEGRTDAALALCRKYSRGPEADDDPTLLAKLLRAEAAMAQEGHREEARPTLLDVAATKGSPLALEARALLGLLDAPHADATPHLAEVAAEVAAMDEEARRTLLTSMTRLGLLTAALSTKGQMEEAKKDDTVARESYALAISLAELFFSSRRAAPDARCRDAVEDSIYRCAILKLKAGEGSDALEQLRSAMRSPFPPSRRQGSRVLAHLSHALLYDPQAQNSYTPAPSAPDRFTPSTAEEEAVLAALLREQQREEGTEVYHDLLLVFARNREARGGCEAMERALARHPEDALLWRQFALSLLAAGRYEMALAVIKECLELSPQPFLLLLAAKVCLNYLERPTEAVEHSKRCVEVCSGLPRTHLLARAHHALGCSLSAQAALDRTAEKLSLHKGSVEALSKAAELGCGGYLLHHHTALEYAHLRDIDAALSHCRKAVDLNPAHADSWLLLVLLLTSKKAHTSAASVCRLALEHHTSDPRLMYMKARLEMAAGNQAAALRSLEQACRQCRVQQLADEADDADVSGSESDSRSRSRTMSLASLDELPDDRSTVSHDTMFGLPAAAFQERQRGFEVDSMRLWVTLSKVFRENGQLEDASQCLAEARASDRLHPDLVHEGGRLCEAGGDEAAARAQYRKALALCSSHLPSLLALARLNTESGDVVEAEDQLRSAVRQHPAEHRAWFQLGMLYQRQEKHEQACDCLEVAVELEETSPLVPFSLLKAQL